MRWTSIRRAPPRTGALAIAVVRTSGCQRVVAAMSLGHERRRGARRRRCRRGRRARRAPGSSTASTGSTTSATRSAKASRAVVGAEAAEGAAADQVGEVVAAGVDAGRARHGQVADLARAARRAAMHGAAEVDGDAEALADPEQREAVGRLSRAGGALGDRGEVHVVVEGDLECRARRSMRRRAPSSGQPGRVSVKLRCVAVARDRRPGRRRRRCRSWRGRPAPPRTRRRWRSGRRPPACGRHPRYSTSTTGWSPSRASTTVAAIDVLADVDGDAARAVGAYAVADGVRARGRRRPRRPAR